MGLVGTHGQLTVRLVFDPSDVKRAREHLWVREVHGPWLVRSRDEAMDKLEELLNNTDKS